MQLKNLIIKRILRILVFKNCCQKYNFQTDVKSQQLPRNVQLGFKIAQIDLLQKWEEGFVCFPKNELSWHRKPGS